MLKSDKIKVINNIFNDYESILVAYLFGSQSRNKENKYSDVDIAILFDNSVKKEEYTNIQIEIMNNLSRELDKEADVVVLNRASLFLKYHVLKDGIKIYERKDRNEHNFEAQAIVQYLDFLPVKNRIEKSLLAKIRGNKW
ncbi:MAG: nucleotidyltransferase domain-containing protein [Candidatus Omnitrophica bacterium]|nr:nucleotidyltransferase domain-containing protein [Candidatus Omnitrophota bacterium]